MNKIKERNTFSIEVNSDESSPPHRDHADPSILDSSDMDRHQVELHLQRPSVTGGGYCTKKCFDCPLALYWNKSILTRNRV